MSNSGHIIGNLTDKPELRYTPDGKAYARFSVAVANRKFNRATNAWEDGLTDFCRCVAFGNEAEGLANIDKGVRVVLLGDWKPNEYTDKEGILRKEREFVVKDGGPSVKFQTVSATRNPRSGGNGGGGGGGGGYQNQNQHQQPQQGGYGGGQPGPSIGDGFDEQPF